MSLHALLSVLEQRVKSWSPVLLMFYFEAAER
jgi:hypothetical protein